MATRNADAEWRGDLKTGKDKVSLGSGAFEGVYSFKSRVADGKGTDPEELIAATAADAKANCSVSKALNAVEIAFAAKLV